MTDRKMADGKIFPSAIFLSVIFLSAIPGRRCSHRKRRWRKIFRMSCHIHIPIKRLIQVTNKSVLQADEMGDSEFPAVWKSVIASDTETLTELTRRNYDIRTLITDPAYSLQYCDVRRPTPRL